MLQSPTQPLELIRVALNSAYLNNAIALFNATLTRNAVGTMDWIADRGN
jgi:hypothetical protein